jgi:hypothetical protein
MARRFDTTNSGGSGTFVHLLRTYPELKDLIDGHILRRYKRKKIYESRIRITSLHKLFMDRSRKLNLDEGMKYPFNTTRLACVALSESRMRQISRFLPMATGCSSPRKIYRAAI